MTNAETKHALQAKREELIRKICRHAGDLDIGAGEADMIDRIQSMADRDETAAILSLLSSTLADVDRSLRAIPEGFYGICTRCEEPIAVKRLQVIPWAAYCRRCQEHFESVQAGRYASYFDEGRAA